MEDRGGWREIKECVGSSELAQMELAGERWMPNEAGAHLCDGLFMHRRAVQSNSARPDAVTRQAGGELQCCIKFSFAWGHAFAGLRRNSNAQRNGNGRCLFLLCLAAGARGALAGSCA